MICCGSCDFAMGRKFSQALSAREADIYLRISSLTKRQKIAGPFFSLYLWERGFPVRPPRERQSSMPIPDFLPLRLP
jgi:hypothetical protein